MQNFPPIRGGPAVILCQVHGHEVNKKNLQTKTFEIGIGDVCRTFLEQIAKQAKRPIDCLRLRMGALANGAAWR